MITRLQNFFHTWLSRKNQTTVDSILAVVEDPIIIVGLDDLIITCNRAAQALAGISGREITNTRIQEAFAAHPVLLSELALPEDNFPKKIHLTLAGDEKTYELIIRCLPSESNKAPVSRIISLKDKTGSPTFSAAEQPHHTPSNQIDAQSQAALQIDSEPIDQRPSQLAILNDIGEGIATSIEQNAVISRAVHLIQQYFNDYHVAIFTPDEAQNLLVLQFASGAYTKVIPDNLSFKPGQGMVGWVAENQSYLLANNVLIEPNFNSVNPETMPTRSELTIPILVSDKVVGVLDIQSPVLNAFGEDDVRMLRMISGQIAVAMENARLYEELRLQLKERERGENILRIQRDLLVKLSTATTLEETLQTTLDMLATELHASRAIISLLDRETQNLSWSVSYHAKKKRSSLTPLVNPVITEWVAKNALPMLVQSTQSLLAGFPPGAPNILYIPLMLSKKVLGVITLESGEGRIFTQEDMQAVNNLPTSLVMLIERARLFEEVQNARGELEARAAELEEANANLRELDRLKSQFLANISHELRTPLNSIIGFSEILVDEVTGPLNSEQMEHSQDILDSGRHLLALINNLLDFTQTTADKMNLRISTFPVDRLFSELHDTMAPLIARKSQNLVFSQKTELPLLSADYLRIKQVFYNLISNANKFSPSNGNIYVSCEKMIDDQVLFQVSDNGIGIDPKDQKIIFEEFRQVDGSMTREVPGTGLGLSISRRIIELHHGKIWVISESGKGASFFFQIPVCFYPEGSSPVQ